MSVNDASVPARCVCVCVSQRQVELELKCGKTSLTAMTWFRFAATGQCLLLLGQQAGASASCVGNVLSVGERCSVTQRLPLHE